MPSAPNYDPPWTGNGGCAVNHALPLVCLLMLESPVFVEGQYFHRETGTEVRYTWHSWRSTSYKVTLRNDVLVIDGNRFVFVGAKTRSGCYCGIWRDLHYKESGDGLYWIESNKRIIGYARLEQERHKKVMDVFQFEKP